MNAHKVLLTVPLMPPVSILMVATTVNAVQDMAEMENTVMVSATGIHFTAKGEKNLKHRNCTIDPLCILHT